MQLYFRSCVDVLVSFALQQQHPPGHGSADGLDHGASVSHQMKSNTPGRQIAGGGSHAEEEVHLVSSGEQHDDGGR